MPLSLKKKSAGVSSQTKGCPYSRKEIRTAVAVHCGSLKYHSNILHPKNKYRSDLDGIWQKTESEIITAKDRAYSKSKSKQLIVTFKAHGKSMRNNHNKPSHSRNARSGIDIPALLTKAPHDRTRADRMKKSKEINKLIKSKLKVWRLNRPLMKGRNEKGETITTQIIHLVEEWTKDIPIQTKSGLSIKTKKRKI